MHFTLLKNETCNYLKNKGYFVVETNGMFDIIAIQPSNDMGIYNYPLLIQCRTNQHNENRWQGFNLIVSKEDGVLTFRTPQGVKIKSI